MNIFHVNNRRGELCLSQGRRMGYPACDCPPGLMLTGDPGCTQASQTITPSAVSTLVPMANHRAEAKGYTRLATALILQWRHDERDGVLNHMRLDCLLNHLFRRRSKKTPMIHVTGLWEGNSPGTDEVSAQRASNAENVSIWWRHHVRFKNMIAAKCLAFIDSTACVPYEKILNNLVTLFHVSDK